ncbi:MAG: sensor histidine kinase, partial [Pontiella sp.]|nr:sensor histidine kinase [Pontiella sp.]
IPGFVLRCLDGSHRDVELLKYSAADHCMLYAVCDVTRPQLNEEIAQVSTRERRRIGQDLHDSIGQLLTGISLLSRSLANNLRRDGNPGEEDAAQISELADDASNQIRQISRGLMPADIVERGFFASLRDLARITTDSCGIQCEVRLDETVDFNDGAVETHLFRIAQEAVNNAVRHADASQIEIVFSVENGRPQLQICDDGTWKKAADHMSGIGMKTMHYRASVIGGNLTVGAVEEGGTHVVCRLEAEELFETKVV